ncbi:cupin [candidate division WOR-1 bacterium DG_54_3]|jgi:quercetin dioxygenase-like cupin family protein|uniref:Cupin n=1 Tax=candidate division WOR-1 bacterium DG_54_3 TaxID=1703775 RepID=A0A0S7Y6U0_UNCSA|nr:MAG: cupin [candidate division WOR-1 bacterium DG_54_3]
MRIKNYKDTEAEKVSDTGAKGVTIRWLISEKDGAPNFAMRLFEIEPGGNTPYHKHKWEHEVFILKGEGNLITETETSPLKQGDAVFVPGEENHQFKNTSRENLVFLCLVPIEKQP